MYAGRLPRFQFLFAEKLFLAVYMGGEPFFNDHKDSSFGRRGNISRKTQMLDSRFPQHIRK